MLAYKEDPTGTNPYAETATSILSLVISSGVIAADAISSLDSAVSLKDVQEELGHEEAKERKWGVISLPETTASVFISMGLDLKEQQ